MPQPRARTLAEGRVVVNELLLYWIQHGRVRVVPAISRFEGSTVHFVDGTAREYDTILWATGFHASLPFLDRSLVQRRNDVPLRYAAGIVPAGLEKLYYIGLAAPRGPQIPVYGVQAKLAIRMVALHEAAGESGAGIASYLAALQEPDDRIDIVRVDLERAAGRHRAAARRVRRRSLPTAGRLVRLVRLSRGQRRHVAHVTEDEAHIPRPRRDVARLTDEAPHVPSLRHLLAHDLRPRTPDPHVRRDVSHAAEGPCARSPDAPSRGPPRGESDVLRLMRHIPSQLR